MHSIKVQSSCTKNQKEATRLAGGSCIEESCEEYCLALIYNLTAFLTCVIRQTIRFEESKGFIWRQKSHYIDLAVLCQTIRERPLQTLDGCEGAYTTNCLASEESCVTYSFAI